MKFCKAEKSCKFPWYLTTERVAPLTLFSHCNCYHINIDYSCVKYYILFFFFFNSCSSFSTCKGRNSSACKYIVHFLCLARASQTVWYLWSLASGTTALKITVMEAVTAEIKHCSWRLHIWGRIIIIVLTGHRETRQKYWKVCSTVQRSSCLWGFIAATERSIYSSEPYTVLYHLSGENMCTLKINNSPVAIICDEPIHNIPLDFHSEPPTVHSHRMLRPQFWGGGLFDMQTLQQTKEER